MTAQLLEHAVRQGLAGAVPARRAEVVVGRLDLDAVGLDRRAQHLQPLGDHLRTDAVAADDRDPRIRHAARVMGSPKTAGTHVPALVLSSP